MCAHKVPNNNKHFNHLALYMYKLRFMIMQAPMNESINLSGSLRKALVIAH